MTRIARLALVVVALALALPGPAFAANITVNTTDDEIGEVGCSLREAISAANDDDDGPGNDCLSGNGTDTISLGAGNYALGIDGPDDNTNATGDLDVDGQVIIDGAGAGATTVNGAALDDRILDIISAIPVELRDLTLTNGNAPDGAAGSPGVDGPPSGTPSEGGDGGDGQDGGAILNQGGALTLTSVVITNCSAGDGGAGGAGQSAGSASPGEEAPGSFGGPGGDGGRGGAITTMNVGTVIAVDTRFTGNRGGEGGAGGDGGVGQDGSSGNRGGDSGGGLGGGGGSGAAIFAFSGTLEFTRVTFDANAGGAGGDGGGAGASGSGGASSGPGGFSGGGTGGDAGGGAIATTGTMLTITDSRLSANLGGRGGDGGDGGPAGSGGTPAGIAGDTFGGQGGLGGGPSAIAAFASIDITRTTIDGGSTGDGGDGGDAGSTSTGGQSGGGPGGQGGDGTLTKGAFAGSTFTVTNSTVSGNSTGDGGDGGSGGDAGSGADGGDGAAFNLTQPVGGTFTHVTIASNTTGAGGTAGSGNAPSNGSAGTGGAVRATSGNYVLRNSVIASNSLPQCEGLGFEDGGLNLVFPADVSCAGVPTANPLLGPLANYGGYAPTRSLLAGSAAIGGVPATGANCPPTDQRDVLRPRGTACDIGAFERAAPSATTGAASGVTQTGASLAGSATANTRPTTYRFAYGKTTAYGSLTPPVGAGSGTAPVAAAATLAGLQPGTLYHYRLVVSNSDGTANGADRTFTTVVAPKSTTPTTPPGTTLPAFGGVSLLTKSARADRKGRVSVKVRCPASAVTRCRGKLSLTAKVNVRRKGKTSKTKTIKLGSASFTIDAGKTKTVGIKLSKSTRRLLASSKQLKGSLSAAATDTRGGKAKTTKGKLRVRAPKRNRR